MRLVRITITCLSLFCCITASGQRVVENTRHGFKVTVPGDWIDAQDSFLTRFSRAVSKQGQQLRYVGAYQQASFDEGLVYPYVLIQTIPYLNMGLDRPPTTEERSQLFTEMTGLDLNETMDANLSKEVASLIEGTPSINNLSYDEHTGGFTYDLDMYVADFGAVRGRIRGIYGDWAILQAAYYTTDGEWKSSEDEADTILRSFDTLAGTAQPDYASVTPLRRLLGGVFRGAMGGAIIGGLFALVGVLGFYIYRKRSTPKPPPL